MEDAAIIVESTGDSVAVGAAKDLLFGSIGGMVGKVFEYPFDTVKVRLQSQPEDRPLRYKGPLDCFKQSLQQTGVRGLYRGISPPLFGAAAENAALFFGYNLAQEAIRNMTGNRDGELSIQQKLFCGATTGAFASFILTPIELVKCQMQVQQIGKAVTAGIAPKAAVAGIPSAASIHTASIRPPGPFALVGQIYGAYGLSGLWRGQMGTLLRETGGSAAWFGSYEFVSMYFKEKGKKDTTTVPESMMAGAAAGVLYNFILFPADTIKSRMQTEAIGVGGKSAGFLDVTKTIHRHGGIKAFYRGCGITVARSAPSSALIFTVYEGLKSYF